MAGSTRRRSGGEGTYRYQVSRRRWTWKGPLAPGPDGQRRWKYLYGPAGAPNTPAGRRELEERVLAWRVEQLAGDAIDAERQTVEQFIRWWLEHIVKRTRDPATYDKHKRRAENHIIPTLGRYQLDRLTSQRIQVWVNGLGDKGLQPITVVGIVSTLRTVLTYAVKHRVLRENRATVVELPRVGRSERPIYDPDQARAVLTAAAGEWYGIAFVLMLALGLRRGEAFGLRWADVDLERGQLTVRRQYVQQLGRMVMEEETKSAAGRRTVPLPAVVVTHLRRWRRWQAEVQLATKSWRDQGLVVTSERGGTASVCTTYATWKRVCATAGVPHLRLHDLRHTCASFLLAEGIDPRTVMALLGQSTMALTIERYGHVMDHQRTRAAGRMDQLLSDAEAVKKVSE